MKENLIMLVDSYKLSQPAQYPDTMVEMFGYMEARSSKVYPATVFFGLQYYIKKYLQMAITMDDVNEAKEFALAHGEPFNYAGWKYISELGYIPISIRAVKEGSLIPNGNVLMTIKSTDEKVAWIEGWAETLLMKIWYPCTVATKSYYVKQMLLESREDVDFAYHNFGDRGATSVEAAAIGGMAHLTQFMGTDNFNSLRYASEYYDANMAGFSIPATEHSTVTSWGRENEFAFYDRYLAKNKGTGIIACVMDSYNIYDAVDYVTSGEFKRKVESDDYPIFVIRPDSGDPEIVLKDIISILHDNVACTEIDGLVTFDKYRVIWGDGVTPEVIRTMDQIAKSLGISPDMVNFGSGGDLMQNINRDTLGFAVKCSSITMDEGSPIDFDNDFAEWEPHYVRRDVYKDPLHGSKKSKKGELMLYQNRTTGEYETGLVGESSMGRPEVLDLVFENGQLIRDDSWDDIKARS